MFRGFVVRLSYANVTATIALFLALGGGAYAMTLPNNSVKSKTIKNGQVKSADVQNNGVTGTDVKESSLVLPVQTKKLLYNKTAADPGTQLATVGPWTLVGECNVAGSDFTVRLKVTFSGASASVNRFAVNHRTGGDDAPVANGSPLFSGDPVAGAGSTTASGVTEERNAGTLYLERAGTLARVDYHVVATTSSCLIYGTATLAA